MRKIRRRLTPKESRESARNAIRAFGAVFREDSMGIGAGNSAMGELGDGVALDRPDSSYHVRRSDVTAIAEPYQDGGESEAEGSGKFAGALRRGGYKHMKDGMYENARGHRVYVKGDEAYSEDSEGKKRYFSSEAELECVTGKRESIRSFFRRYAREV